MVLVKNGDHRAFTVVYDRYASRMKAFFYRMLWSDDTMAEDFVHDLFTRIIERPDVYNADRAFAPWLFQVASNMCKNAYRKRQFEMDYRDQLNGNHVHHPDVDQKMDEKILMDELHHRLNDLEEDRRQLFLLRYQQQLSVKELAAVFETSEVTIKSRLLYIKKRLLKSMREDQNVMMKENGK